MRAQESPSPATKVYHIYGILQPENTEKCYTDMANI